MRRDFFIFKPGYYKLMVYSGAWGKLIHEKTQQLKISWHCPFKRLIILAQFYPEIGDLGLKTLKL